MSSKPSLLMSTMLTPVAQTCVVRPAFPVTSSKLPSPLLRYRRQVVWFPVKKTSFNPSLLKSPMPTPPPIYPNSSIKELVESSSLIVLLKWMPVLSAGILLNIALCCCRSQETKNKKTKRYSIFSLNSQGFVCLHHHFPVLGYCRSRPEGSATAHLFLHE